MNNYKTPESVELEELILGAIMIEQDCIPIVLEILHKDCFYNPVHIILFSAIENLFKRKESVDIETVVYELRRLNKLDEIGGAYYVTKLTNRVASSANIETWCRIVLQQYIRRKIIEVSTHSITEAYDDGKDCLSVLDTFIAEGKSIYDHITFGITQSTDDLLVELMADIEQTEVKGLSTGIKALDEYIVCLEKGLKYTIAGRPGQGKTSSAKSIAVNLINQGSPGIIFTMEMTEKQFMVQIVSGICDIDSERIRKKELTPIEKESIWTKMKAFKKELLIIDGRSNVTPGYMTKKVKKAIKTHKIEWFMVDYTQMGRVDNPKGKMKEERVAEFSQAIKDIAKSENIIAIELAQLVKAPTDKGESKRPQLSDIRDSGMIEASADCVLLLYRSEYYGFQTIGPPDRKESSIGVAEIIIAKNRQGRVGSVLTTFLPQYTKFIDRQQIQHTQENNLQDSTHVF